MTELHDYQRLARDFLINTPRAGIFLDPGLGKTAITLSALTPEHLPALVVAPKRVAEHVWPTEQRLWRPDLSLSLAAGGPQARAIRLAAQSDITVIGRDNLADALPYRYRTLVLDESSGFKNRATTRWKTAKKINTQHCWELTGTPSPNGLMDLWAQIFLLDKGERLGKNITGFRNRYFMPGRQLPNGVIIEWHIRPESADHIHRLISDICLSMDADDYLDLPPVTYNTITVDLPTSVRKQYKDFKRDLVLDLDLIGGEIHSAGNAATLTGRLSQMSAGFVYSDDGSGAYDRLHTEKLEALREIVDGQGSPILVFYHFRAEYEMIREAFPHARSIDDDGAIETWNRGEVPMLLAHPASAGHGLNLQHGGHTIVWTTLPWSLELWEQANARLARQGQKHPVVVHTLQTEGTVDAVIRRSLDNKTFVQDELLDYLRSPM